MTLNANYEKLIEQIRIANQNRFGRQAEKLDVIECQLSLFDETEKYADPKGGERPKDLIRNSIVTASLGGAILNGKYVNALPLTGSPWSLNATA